MDWDARQNFEDDELEFIGNQVRDGYTSGITPYGTTWNLDVSFEYPEDEDE